MEKEVRQICYLLFVISRVLAYYDYNDNGYMSDLGMDWSVLGVRAHQPKCVDIPSSMQLCKDIGYKTMRLPNLLDHESLAEAVDQSKVWVPLSNIHCHPDTKLFLCSLYSPVCLDPSVYPCRSLCEGVKRKCEKRINNYGYPWPDILNCSKFPDELCIEQVNFENAANVCEPCKRPLTYESLLDSYCWSSYVFKVRIDRVVDRGDGDKKLIIKGSIKSYKPKSMSKQDKENVELILRNGASCDCDAAEKANKSSLVTASKIGNDYVVTYVSDWAKNKEFKRAIRAIRKGHDCKLEIGDPNNQGGLGVDGGPLPPVDDSTTKGEKTEDDKDKKSDKKNKKHRKKDKKDKEEDPMINIVGVGCIPCKQPLVFENLIEKYCDSDFVMKAKVRKVKIDDNGDKRLIVKKLKQKDFYKQENLSKRDVKKLQPVIGGGSNCDCESAVKNSKLFVMGRKQGVRYVVNFVSEDAKDSEFKRFLRAIRKGYDCSKVANNQ